MNLVDWNAYVDQTMPLAERREVERNLRENAALRAQHQHFLAYRENMRAAALSQPVPLGELQADLHRIAATPAAPARHVWAMRLAPVLGALVLLAWAMLRSPAGAGSAEATVLDPFGLAHSAGLAASPISDPASASNWIQQKTAIDAPPLTMPVNTSMCGVQAGKNWARYEMTLPEERVYLYVANSDSFKDAPQIRHEGRTFYMGKFGIGWRKNGLSYYLEGCSSPRLLESATFVYDRIIP